MVIVVPALTQSQYTHDRVVATVIMAFVGLSAPDMAHGVHAPGDMMLKEDADEPTPEETGESSKPTSAENTTQNRRNEQAQQDPETKELADDPQIWISLEIRDIALLIGLFNTKQPAEV